MDRVALIYNPASGQEWPRRKTVVDKTLALLREAGLHAESIETDGPGSAESLTCEAVGRGCDTILACGGDGTVHEVLQCLVGTNVALGVVPLGTANALAADLGLGSSAVRTAGRLLDAVPVRVPVGRVFYTDAEGVERSRYFTVAAGVGADALFLSRLDAKLKRKLGYLLYLVEAFRVWATHSFPLFEAAFQERGAKGERVERISQLLVVRIRDFGGVLHHLAPGASLRKENLSLIAFKTRSRFHYMRFLLAVVWRRQTFLNAIELVDADSVECRVLNGSRSHLMVEADGELLGSLPARFEIVPEALTLLIPAGAQP
jgi:diacylglycerol kinase family enzyme